MTGHVAHHPKRRHVAFIEHLVHAVEIFCCEVGPEEVHSGPMHELAVHGAGRRQSNATFTVSIGNGQKHAANKW